MTVAPLNGRVPPWDMEFADTIEAERLSRRHAVKLGPLAAVEPAPRDEAEAATLARIQNATCDEGLSEGEYAEHVARVLSLVQAARRKHSTAAGRTPVRDAAAGGSKEQSR